MRKTSITLLALTILPCSLFSADKKAEIPTNVDFMTQVKPLIEGTCLDCHGTHEQEGDYRMDTKAAAFKGGGDYGKEVIKPGDSNDSPVYWMTTEPEDGERMPPKHPLTIAQQNILKVWIDKGAKWPDGVELVEKSRINFKNAILPILKKGGPFNAKQKETMQLWLDQGAVWPEGFELGAGAPAGGPADDLKLVEKIREAIIANSPEKTEADMKAYENTIPSSGAKYEMIPIKGGEFMMGSPKDEKGRFDDEGPQHKVKVDPFWMGKFEVTWNMYEPFMITGIARNKDGSPEKVKEDAAPIDIISSPTTPYVEMSFGMGNNGFPAISMTQHAAQKYCEWLSAQTGHYYRLPTEAEWEYACRAGTTGPFSCAEKDLADYAVLDPEEIRVGYEKIGTKKPNPWGLYDMHGNVMEWVLDQYLVDTYEKRAKNELTVNPLAIPDALYPRVARGGSWYDPASDLRSARRIFSGPEWKDQDPQLPKSIWFHTDANWLGFRLVRPLNIPDAKGIHKIWNMGFGEE